MTRIEELSARVADGIISEEERRELDALLADDPQARAVFLSTLETEAALRRRRRDVDVAARVMEGIERAREDRVVSGVMAFARRSPPPAAWTAGARRPRVWFGPVLVLAAAGLLAIVAASAVRRAREGDALTARAVTPATPTLATVIEARQATLDRAPAAGAGQAAVASPGAAVHAGDRLEVSGQGALALAYQVTTRIELGAATRARLAGAGAVAPGAPGAAGAGARGAGAAGGAAHVIEVDRGTVKATVGAAAGRSALVFVTPHARATVLGTRFTLTVTQAFTRLDVAEGRVAFDRLFEPEAAAVEVGAGQHALGFGDRRALALRAPPPPPPAAPSARTVLSFDFEDGALPEHFVGGHAVPGPPRAGNRYCLIGSVDSYLVTATSITVERTKGLMSYNSRFVLSFDYWVGADAEELMVQVWAPELGQNFFIDSGDFVRESWGRAELRLSDFKPRVDPARPLRDGERLANIKIFGGRTAGKPLYVDNLRLVEHTAETIPPVSSFRSTP
jgi:hypothetical protein